MNRYTELWWYPARESIKISMRIYYRWRLHRRHLSMESCRPIDSLVNIWRTKIFLEKLPDHFTAMLQLAQGLEYIHSQKWIHGDIKPENVLIFENYSRKAITLKWACFGFSFSEEQQNFDIKKETNPKEGTQGIKKFLEKQKSETNIEKETGNTVELSTKRVVGKLSPATLSVEQGRKWKNSEKMKTKMSLYVMTEKYYKGTEPRTWLAPELQEVSNPILLATFESDVFALGLVFGSLLLDGDHPFGDQHKEITSNMKMNNPVNFESKLENFHIFCIFSYSSFVLLSEKNSKRILELIKRMLTQKAEERITTSEVVDEIKSIQNEVNISQANIKLFKS
jgi:serine/threonine protein kinase